MVISEIDYVSYMNVAVMIRKLALVIDAKLLHVGLCVMNRTDSFTLQAVYTSTYEWE